MAEALQNLRRLRWSSPNYSNVIFYAGVAMVGSVVGILRCEHCGEKQLVSACLQDIASLEMDDATDYGADKRQSENNPLPVGSKLLTSLFYRESSR